MGTATSLPVSIYAMRFGYRITSIAVLLVIAMTLSVPRSVVVRTPMDATVSSAGDVYFDPCSMWEQIAVSVRIATLAWVATFLALLIQGLRNRTLPRFVPLIGVAGFVWSIRGQWWELSHCESNTG